MNKIGIDFDGVVVNVVDSILSYMELNNRGRFYPKVITNYNFWEGLNVTKEEMSNYFAEPNTYAKMDFIHEADTGLKSLHKFGYELYAITVRPNSVMEFTAKWAEENKLPFSSIIHCTSSGEKATNALKLGLEYFVEDKLETCVELFTICNKVFLFDAHYNRSSGIPSNIIRVYSWTELLKHLYREISNGKQK